MQQGRSLKQAKQQRVEKKRKARRRKRAFVLIAEVVVFSILLCVGFVMEKYGKFQFDFLSDKDIAINEGVSQTDYTTVALFGSDSREGYLESETHADTMIIASIDNDTKEVRIVSVYRDLLTKQEDGIKKSNNAYFVGGAKNAINMLNTNFDLNITDYVTVDFGAVVSVVDLLGGVEIDVSEAEAKEMNRHIVGTAQLVGKQTQYVQAGVQNLDGVEALTYARIRKNVGGDYARTERQRVVIQELAKKAKGSDLSTINDIIDEVFSQISTSFTLKELFGLAAGAMQYEIKDTAGFPFEHTDGNVEGVGSVVIPMDVVKNVEQLHTFLYPKSEYKASETVKTIASEIEAISAH